MTTEQKKKYEDIQAKWGNSTCGRSIEAFIFEELEGENERLRTTLVAGAELIKENWSKLCDKEGYGPQNLLLRMDGTLNSSGYPSYSSGEFERLRKRCEDLEAMLERVLLINHPAKEHINPDFFDEVQKLLSQ